MWLFVKAFTLMNDKWNYKTNNHHHSCFLPRMPTITKISAAGWCLAATPFARFLSVIIDYFAFKDKCCFYCKIALLPGFPFTLGYVVFAVCSACDDNVHAGEIPTRLHVPAQCPSASCPPFHLCSNPLFWWTVGDQTDRSDLNRFSSDGECNDQEAIISFYFSRLTSEVIVLPTAAECSVRLAKISLWQDIESQTQS